MDWQHQGSVPFSKKNWVHRFGVVDLATDPFSVADLATDPFSVVDLATDPVKKVSVGFTPAGPQLKASP